LKQGIYLALKSFSPFPYATHLFYFLMSAGHAHAGVWQRVVSLHGTFLTLGVASMLTLLSGPNRAGGVCWAGSYPPPLGVRLGESGSAGDGASGAPRARHALTSRPRAPRRTTPYSWGALQQRRETLLVSFKLLRPGEVMSFSDRFGEIPAYWTGKHVSGGRVVLDPACRLVISGRQLVGITALVTILPTAPTSPMCHRRPLPGRRRCTWKCTIPRTL